MFPRLKHEAPELSMFPPVQEADRFRSDKNSGAVMFITPVRDLHSKKVSAGSQCSEGLSIGIIPCLRELN